MIVYGSAPRRRQSRTSTTICRRCWPAAAAARFSPGRHVRYPDETPITNLYLSMLDRMGVPVESDSATATAGWTGSRTSGRDGRLSRAAYGALTKTFVPFDAFDTLWDRATLLPPVW